MHALSYCNISKYSFFSSNIYALIVYLYEIKCFFVIFLGDILLFDVRVILLQYHCCRFVDTPRTRALRCLVVRVMNSSAAMFGSQSDGLERCDVW